MNDLYYFLNYVTYLYNYVIIVGTWVDGTCNPFVYYSYHDKCVKILVISCQWNIWNFTENVQSSIPADLTMRDKIFRNGLLKAYRSKFYKYNL